MNDGQPQHEVAKLACGVATPAKQASGCSVFSLGDKDQARESMQFERGNRTPERALYRTAYACTRTANESERRKVITLPRTGIVLVCTMQSDDAIERAK